MVNKVKNTKVIILSLSLLLVFLVIFSLCIGNYPITLSELLSYIVGKFTSVAHDSTLESVIMRLRLPRIVACVVIGAALAASGLVYQNVFSNNMVSPDLLGVSSSAACGAAIAILLGLSKYLRFASSFVFSILAIVLTTVLSKFLKRKDSLLLSGIITAGFARSCLGLLKYLADPENGELESIVYWEMGSIAKVTWTDLAIITPLIVIILIFLYLMRRRINCLALGKNASLLGINVPLERTVIIAVASLLVSLSTALCGVISWVGLVIPIAAADLTKKGSIEHNYVTTALLGSVFLLVSDNIARAATTSEIPISIMTGASGIIVFCIAIFVKKEKNSL